MNQTEGVSGRRSRLRRPALAAVLGMIFLGGLWFLTRPNPTRLLEQGLAVGRRDPAKGMRVLHRAIDSAGGHYPDAELALCLLFANQGDWESAAAQFAELDRASCRADLLLAFGRTALASNRIPEALDALEAVRARGTRESTLALELLIARYQEWGHKDELIAAARDLTKLEPDNPRLRILLIRLLKGEVRRDVECLEAIREALERNLPDDLRRDLRHQLVEQLIICGDAAGARRELERLIKSEGQSFRIRTYEIDLYRLEGDLDKALALMNDLFPNVRDKAQASLNRGVIYLDMGRYEEAARDLEKSVSAAPQNASAHFKLSEAYRALGRNDEARRHREFSADIEKKRGRIELLLKQFEPGSKNRSICRELSQLYRDLQEKDAAAAWEERAAGE